MFALWLWGKAPDVNRRLQRAGADVYEATHPREKNHAHNLPKRAWTKAQLVELAEFVGFRDPKLAAAVALAESGGIPNALGDNGKSIGLWQINLTSHPEYTRAWLLDPQRNAEAAVKISRHGKNWKWWSAFKSGRYRGFL